MAREKVMRGTHTTEESDRGRELETHRRGNQMRAHTRDRDGEAQKQ